MRENFLVLMENFGKAMSLSAISANSAGSALEKFDIYQESTQAKLTELTNQFQIFANNVIDGQVIKSIIDLGTILLKFANTDIGQAIVKTTLLISTFALLTKGINLVEVAMAKEGAGIFLSNLNALINRTKTLNDVIIGLGSTMMKSPLFVPALIIAGVMALKSAVDMVTTSLEEQREIVQKHSSELQSLQDEYSVLMGKGELTDIEDARLKIIQQQISAKKELIRLEAQELYEMSKPKDGVSSTSRADFAPQEIKGLKDTVSAYQELQSQVSSTAQAEYDRQSKLAELSQAMSTNAQELLNLKEKGVQLTAEDQKLLDVILKITEAQIEKSEATVEVKDSYAIAESAMSDYISELEYLNDVEESVRDGGSLSLEQKDELIKKYPQLTDEVIRTSEGWTIEASSLEILRQQSLKTANDKMNAEKADLENRKASLMAKLALDQAEIRSAQAVTEAMYARARANAPQPEGGYTRYGSSQGFGSPEQQELVSLFGQIAQIDALMGQVAGIGTGRIGGGAKPTAKKESSKDAWKEAFDTQYKHLQHQLTMNEITESQYLDKLDVLYKKYFANKTKYTDEFMQYEEEVYTKRKKLEEELLKERLEAQKETIEKQKDALESLIDKTMELIKSEYDAEKQYYNDLIDQENKKHDDKMDNLKAEIQAKKDALEAELDGYRKIIESQLESLRLKDEERSYNKDLSERQKELAKLESELLEVSMDDTAEGRAKRLELEEKLAEKRLDIEDLQYDRGLTLQEQTLQDELKRYEEVTQSKLDKYDKYLETEEKRYEDSLDNRVEEYQDHIKQIDNYLKQEGRMRQDAMARIESGEKNLFDKLLEYNLIYGDGTKKSFVDIWETATSALDKYADKQLSVLEILGQMDSDLTGIDLTLSGKGSTSGQLSAKGKEQLNQQKYLHDLMVKAQKEGNKNLEKWIVSERLKWGMDKYGSIKQQFHDGGLVGGSTSLKSGEVVAKLLNGELVSTSSQMDTFIHDTLPKMLGISSYANEFSGIKIDMPINFAGGLDNSTLPEFKNVVETAVNKAFDKLNSAMYKKGNIRNAKSLSI